MEVTTSPTISAQKWHRSEFETNVMRLTWGLPRIQMSLFSKRKTPSHIKHSSSAHRLLCSKPSAPVCLCSHLQNCINRKQSSGNRYIFCEYWYGCHWSSRSTTRSVPWDFNSFLSVFSGALQASIFKTAIMTSWATDVSMVGQSHAGDLRVATSCLTGTLLQSSERVPVWIRSTSKT